MSSTFWRNSKNIVTDGTPPGRAANCSSSVAFLTDLYPERFSEAALEATRRASGKIAKAPYDPNAQGNVTTITRRAHDRYLIQKAIEEALRRYGSNGSVAYAVRPHTDFNGSSSGDYVRALWSRKGMGELISFEEAGAQVRLNRIRKMMARKNE